MTAPDYRRIAEQSVSLLLSVGCWGLHSSRQRELWQRGLDLDRQLHPSMPPATVWTPEDGDIDPPRGPGGIPVSVIAEKITALSAPAEAATTEHVCVFAPGLPGPCECGNTYAREQVKRSLAGYLAERAGSYVTASMVQRKVRIGWARAATELNRLADDHVISMPDSKGRYHVPAKTTETTPAGGTE